MKLRNLFAFVLGASFLLAGCQKTLLGEEKANTPVNNFESLWKGYDQWYGGFATKNLDWDSMHTVYRTKVNDQMTPTQLYDVLSGLIKPLDDVHVFLQPTTDGLPRYESNTFFRNNKVQEDFSIAVIKQHYLPALVEVDPQLHYGILTGNVGYLHFGGFGKSLAYYQETLPPILEALKGTKGLILDIRNHAGGADEVSRYVAGLFAREHRLFMSVRKRNGPARTDFSPFEDWYVQKEGRFPYVKPVILLTTRWTASAGETFTWALKTQSHVTHMGDRTAGGFSDVVARELPNGWLYFVGVGDYRNAQGLSEEGTGIVPAITATNTKEDIQAGRDKVLEQAITRFP